MHPSKSTTVPVIVFIVLLCDLPLPSTTTSTRSPRSCHRPVAGDRAALPASMTRRPAVVAGPVDSAGTPQSAYTCWGQGAPPSQHSCRNPVRHWPTRDQQVGKTSSQSKFDPHTLEKVSFARQGCSAWVGSRSRGKDYSVGGTSSPRPPPSHQGDDICNCNWRADDRPRGQDKARSPLRVPSATSRHVELPGTRTNSPPRVPSATSRWHVEQSSTRTSAWADMRWLPARRQVAGVPHWHAQRLLTHRRGDTAVAPALGAPAQGVHTAPPGFLVLKTLTEATAPCSPASSASSRGHGPFGCPGRQCPLRWPACLGVSSL